MPFFAISLWKESDVATGYGQSAGCAERLGKVTLTPCLDPVLTALDSYGLRISNGVISRA